MLSGLRERGLRRNLAPKAPSRKCHVRGVLGRPGLAQSCSRAILAALGCSRLLLGCSWLLPAPPTTKPQAHPEHDTQHGQLSLNIALHSEVSRQPGVHQQTRLNEISSRQVSKLDSNDWISSYVPFTTDLIPISLGPYLLNLPLGPYYLE